MNMKKKVVISQFREWIFIDLMIKDDRIEESEEELRFRNQSESEKNSFSSIELLNENESVISNMNDNNMNCDYNILMNRE